MFVLEILLLLLNLIALPKPTTSPTRPGWCALYGQPDLPSWSDPPWERGGAGTCKCLLEHGCPGLGL